jgi:putative DNA primase/helicase
MNITAGPAAATRIDWRGTLLRPGWARGSAGNVEAFPVLPGVEALTIFAGHDASGRGQEAALRAPTAGPTLAGR